MRWINPALRPAVFGTCLTNHVAVSSAAQPGLSVSLAKAGQRGWAAKHSAQWHMLCGFLGTGWRTVVLLCQASLYCRGPLGCGLLGHLRGWKGISLRSNWKDATLDSTNASVLYSCAVVAELLTVAVAEEGPLTRDKSRHTTTLPLRSSTNPKEVGGGAFRDKTQWAVQLKGSLLNGLEQCSLKDLTWLVRVIAPTITGFNTKGHIHTRPIF